MGGAVDGGVGGATLEADDAQDDGDWPKACAEEGDERADAQVVADQSVDVATGMTVATVSSLRLGGSSPGMVGGVAAFRGRGEGFDEGERVMPGR
ncbi:MAG: hypothetical protein MUE97_06575 [Phycisphaerales bacterium]|nr:hypothetical protein [Phycisphaerales bacterium]